LDEYSDMELILEQREALFTGIAQSSSSMIRSLDLNNNKRITNLGIQNLINIQSLNLNYNNLNYY